MGKEQCSLINENEKLIRRAAFKYHNWMMVEPKHHIRNYENMILNSLHYADKNLTHMKEWATRFFKGINPRVQIDPWNKTKYISISNPDVYKTIAASMIPDLRSDVIADINIAVATLKTTVEKTEITPLSLKEVIEEITIITKEWKKVSFRCDRLSVLVTDINLEDKNETVSLGDFWVHLDLTCPLGSPSIESVNKIESRDKFYHPHVSGDDELCSGDGEFLMKEAICQGRLEDYFRIVESILRTYNSVSPYEELRGWYDPDYEGQTYCDRCEEWRPEEDMIYCEKCEEEYCEGCSGNGGSCCKMCGNWLCGECSFSCKACQETICNNCIETCYGCDESHYCSDCLNSCMSCNNYYCESCILSCTNCGDITCNDCIETCKSCGDSCCPECVDEDCSKCKKKTCKECQVDCDYCGVTMCVCCKEKHKCLLSKASTRCSITGRFVKCPQ